MVDLCHSLLLFLTYKYESMQCLEVGVVGDKTMKGGEEGEHNKRFLRGEKRGRRVSRKRERDDAGMEI